MNRQLKYYIYNIKTGEIVADNFKSKQEAYEFIHELDYNETRFYAIKGYIEE